ERVRSAEAQTTGASEGKFPLTEAVARYYFKLMAYKDEYEVARLYSDPAFARKIEGMFEGGYKLKFHLAPPIFNRPDPRTGEARKSEFGPWMMAAVRVLATLKGLGGPPLAPCGERRVAWPSPAPTSRTTCCGRRFAGSIRRCGCSPTRSRKPPSVRFSTGTSRARTYGCSATARSSGTRSSITRSGGWRGCTAFTAASACGRTSTAARCRGPDSCSASTRAAAAAACRIASPVAQRRPSRASRR